MKMDINSTERRQGTKRILVKFVGGRREPQEVFVGSGTTTSDLLSELGLDSTSYFISKGTAETTFGPDEILYPLLADGDLLYVSSMVDAGK
jgi:hypothetical protein